MNTLVETSLFNTYDAPVNIMRKIIQTFDYEAIHLPFEITVKEK